MSCCMCGCRRPRSAGHRIPHAFTAAWGAEPRCAVNLPYTAHRPAPPRMNSPIADPLEFLQGGGAMGERIRAFDWDRHPLGPPARWPQALRMTLGLCLNSSFPTAIYWGQDLHVLYNDAWSVIPAERHPAILGMPAREAWSDIWHVVGPRFEAVMRT